MKKLIFDIETIGKEYETFDEFTRENLSRWIKDSEDESQYNAKLQELKNGLGFSPLTGEVVAIGVLDAEADKGAAYFQSPGQEQEAFEENGVKYEAGTEKEILEKFWNVVNYCNEFISFNGRTFDVPFLMVRSAIHRVKPTKDLMSHRYLSSQRFGAHHIDLLDQLTFYGAVRRKGSLHLWCNAFGIKSPKSDGITGDLVTELFKNKEYLKIAQYNVGDLHATKELYNYWKKYLDHNVFTNKL